MRYWPRHKTCEEIVKLAGFTHTGAGYGWEKPRAALIKEGWIQDETAPRTARLHCQLHEGNIKLHLDKLHPTDPKKHESVATHYLVIKQMKQFSRLDWPEEISTPYPQLRVLRWLGKLRGLLGQGRL